MTVVELNAWSIAKELEMRAVRWINNALPILLAELKRLTPEDTKEMLNSYETKKASITWSTVVWTISNSSDHAVFVERWRSGIVFGYHKPKGNLFYAWEGNKTFARAVDNKRDEIIQIIYNELDR